MPANVLEALAKESEELEIEVMGEGSHARLHRFEEELAEAYPPA